MDLSPGQAFCPTYPENFEDIAIRLISAEFIPGAIEAQHELLWLRRRPERHDGFHVDQFVQTGPVWFKETKHKEEQ